MAAVLKPFDWASDGFTIESLIEGDERDFGSAAKGLAEEGFIASEDTDDTPPVVDAAGGDEQAGAEFADNDDEAPEETQREEAVDQPVEPEQVAEPADLLTQPVAPAPKKRGK